MHSASVNTSSSDISSQSHKFGTFMGAYVPSILMLFGVVIFLRLGWIVGSVGLYSSFTIITLVSLIIFITMLSLSAAATNTRVGKGGTYYIVSRALGIEFGSTIGIALFLKQCVSCAFCVVGFSESFHSLFPQFSLQAIGSITLVLLTILTYISTRFVLKIQIFIFGVIIASFYALFSGGENTGEIINQTEPLSHLSFWAIFALFFPAMTGLESSLSLSGDLKNPSRSLPVGVLSAVITAYAAYMGIAYFLWHHVPASRLIEDQLIIQHIAKFESLIILGIWAATLSSAIGALLGAPRVLQALSEDQVIPSFFGKGFGPSFEPKIATAFTFLFAFIGVWFGSINLIAPILTMICLIAYAALNLSTGLEDFMANPSWRPKFPIHWSISFLGALLCLSAMLLINAGAAIVTLFIVAIAYLLLKRRKIVAPWDDIRYGILMFFARFVLHRLDEQKPSIRSWRPSFLVFLEEPELGSNHLLEFASALNFSKGFLRIASVLPKQEDTQEKAKEFREKIKKVVKFQKIEALISVHEAKNFSSGMRKIASHYNNNSLFPPNTVVFSRHSQEENLIQYLENIRYMHERGLNVAIINEPDTSTHSTSGNIQIWWDESAPRNTELMLIFAYMMRKKSLWKRPNICLIGTASNENERGKKMEQFNALLDRNRLKIKTEILLSPTQFDAELIRSHSSIADTIFLSMRPMQPHETLQVYSQYFQNLPSSDMNPRVALVMSASETPFEQIIQI